MPLRIFNTLTKREEEFVPLEDKHVRMYNCGPTVYDYFHIGNARNFIVAEVIRRYLEYKGYKVTFIQNVTDIEDKIIKRANDTGVTPEQVAQKYTDAYFEDMKNLGILEPTFSPKATEHITDIVEFVNKLVEKGIAYVVDGDVYYDLVKFEGYGKLSGQRFEDTIAGARVEVNEKKHHPADFDLWKKAKDGEPGWDSPWGPGRPGWHIECSVMSSKYLGETFDIHSGGNDLIFPHHENEIAQSEGMTGKPFARYWVHNGMLQTGGKVEGAGRSAESIKMSKSLGNVKPVRELLKTYSPNAIRQFLLSAHYRSPLDLRNDSLDEASSAVERILNCVSMTARLSTQEKADFDNPQGAEQYLNTSIDDAIRKFEESMDDDFNTPGALGAIFELIAIVNKFTSDNPNLSANGKAVLRRVNETLTELCGVLGLNVKVTVVGKSLTLIYNVRSNVTDLVDGLMNLIIEISKFTREKKDRVTTDRIKDSLADVGITLSDTNVIENKSLEENSALIDGLMKLVIEIRKSAREKKDWTTADKIRDGLTNIGIKLEDTREGTIWKITSKT